MDTPVKETDRRLRNEGVSQRQSFWAKKKKIKVFERQNDQEKTYLLGQIISELSSGHWI